MRRNENIGSDRFLPGMVQVAGVHSLAEMEMLLDAGVDLVGLPLRLNVNKEDISEAEAARFSRSYPGRCCLITYMEEPDEIIQLGRDLRVSYIQLHGSVNPVIMPQLLAGLPGTRFFKSLIVGKASPTGLKHLIGQFSSHVHAFITDSFDPESGAEGATGLTHDWEISRQVVRYSPLPVILAGGLNAANVAQAIQAVGPFGVDVHTGVENSSGIKDPVMVQSFVSRAKQALNP